MRQNHQILDRAPGQHLAYRQTMASRPGLPGVMFLTGLRSDMTGSKAEGLDHLAASEGFAFTRFDYFGHGESSGAFEDGTIGHWRADSLAVLDQVTQGPQILVGSSLGGWMALLAGLARPERVKALVLIAPAPDFTEKLLWPHLPEAARQAILGQGYYDQPSAYDPRPMRFTRALFEEAKAHLILDGPIAFGGPVAILQGMADPDVPWPHALALNDALTGGDVRLTLIKDGDHRLSRPQDLALLNAVVLDLVRRLSDRPAAGDL